jgi:cytochrome c oxidase subunit 2
MVIKNAHSCLSKRENFVMKRHVVFVFLLALAACTEDAAPSAPQTPAERGLAFVSANACTACHALDGSRGIGPSWVGIYGSTRTFADGSRALVDEAYLRRSMLEPAAQVVEGFDSVMVPAPVSDAQVLDIIALIRNLRDGPLQ